MVIARTGRPCSRCTAAVLLTQRVPADVELLQELDGLVSKQASLSRVGLAVWSARLTVRQCQENSQQHTPPASQTAYHVTAAVGNILAVSVSPRPYYWYDAFHGVVWTAL